MDDSECHGGVLHLAFCIEGEGDATACGRTPAHEFRTGAVRTAKAPSGAPIQPATPQIFARFAEWKLATVEVSELGSRWTVEFAAMDPNWADIVSALAAGIAVVVATFAWSTAVRTHRTSYRPIVRAIPARHPNRDINAAVLILKNIGRGPAVAVSIVEPPPPRGEQWPITHPGPVVVGVDVVEPLGQPLTQDGGETSRIGRVRLEIPGPRLLRRNTRYRLLYQDIGAAWYESTFIFDDNQDWRTEHRGRLEYWDVQMLPVDVVRRTQLVHDPE